MSSDGPGSSPPRSPAPVRLASSPGHPGRANEDFVGAVPGALVLLDGAGIPGTASICHHGVAWYAHTLGTTVLGRLSRHPTVDLVETLADSIEHVAGLHRHSCDLADPSSPQATVAIVRLGGTGVDHLALADAFVVLDRHDLGPLVVTDPREVDVRARCTVPLQELDRGSPAYERALRLVVASLRAQRNQPGGYWIAKDDPAAASEAVLGSADLSEVTGAAVLSNGAARLVDPYGVMTWTDLLTVLRTGGPEEALRRLRAAEHDLPADGSEPDDASLAWCVPDTHEIPA
jgi:hypothetical protein